MKSLIDLLNVEGRISTPDLSTSQLQEAKVLAEQGRVCFTKYHSDIYGKEHVMPVEYVELKNKINN